ISKFKHSNIIFGTQDDTSKTYLVDKICRNRIIDALMVAINIDDTIKFFNIGLENFALLLCDSVRYTTNADDTLKALFPNLSYVI
ncbi:MAG: hypothetical protein MHPSP_004595, partial [Paramarteilia canceri]